MQRDVDGFVLLWPRHNEWMGKTRLNGQQGIKRQKKWTWSEEEWTAAVEVLIVNQWWQTTATTAAAAAGVKSKKKSQTVQ